MSRQAKKEAAKARTRRKDVAWTAHKLAEENTRLREKLTAIDVALKELGLFAFEHVDGSVSLNPR